MRLQQTTVPTSAAKEAAVSTGIPEATDLPIATSAVTVPWRTAAMDTTAIATSDRIERLFIWAHSVGWEAGVVPPSGKPASTMIAPDARSRQPLNATEGELAAHVGRLHDAEELMA